MIWVDASFAIAWLLGEKRAQLKTEDSLYTLPAQVVEIFVYFKKRAVPVEAVMKEIQPLTLFLPTLSQTLLAADFYISARKVAKKASQADALLAAVSYDTHGQLLSFDGDFKHLKHQEKTSGHWYPINTNESLI